MYVFMLYKLCLGIYEAKVVEICFNYEHLHQILESYLSIVDKIQISF